ncbi:putative DNA polymerase delta subunit 2 [Talaromyces proteolyticus]|uniref:DNA-directed DNA polymerase n=1 Tax=Talaromyces proteolyticus TaxID=1131652 RepID=A0AAD4KR24_9EURO|nr:putative DNA polymerase delta subunit 2 [Talaromyces proteolyticus]KAH8693707.1 putative DNA polymerase delta subunit 2 [Talaromyces proteolyticus]
MTAAVATSEDFLQPPSGKEYPPRYRAPSAYAPLHTFQLPKADNRQYQQQYGDLYFLRLAKLKPAVEKVGREAWEGFNIAEEKARKVERVLDVRQGELCWVVGTVYMDLPLKPNILDDVAHDNFAAAPPPRLTYLDPSNPDSIQVMLEDESGRLRLAGSLLRATHLVTGVIIAVLGTENSNGDFEVIDIKVPDLPLQPQRWERASTDKIDQKLNRVESTAKSSKIAFVSGLGMTGSAGDGLTLELLTEYLLGYTGVESEEDTSPTRISRLVIAGNSLGEVETLVRDVDTSNKKKNAPKKYGYDASSYNPSPIIQLDNFLSEILPSIPITLMPGERDPANFSLPQQSIHRAMLPKARMYCSEGQPGSTDVEPGWFDNVTNPWEGYVDGWRLWGCSGQNVDDVLRYLDFSDEDGNITEGEDGETRIRVMEAMLKWRCTVPTAPDTLWCYPFQTHDPFILQACPHIFFVGNQPQFRTMVVESEPTFRLNGADSDMPDVSDDQLNSRVRLVSLPKFHETGELVLVDSETLEVEVVKFQLFTENEGE